LQFLAEMVRTGQPASVLARRFEPVPQMLKNVRYTEGTEPLEIRDVKAAIAEGEARLTARAAC
jgi:phosphoglucosamine mutase